MIARSLALLLAGLAAATAATGSFAQAPPVDPAAPVLPPQYEVEIIVFANREFDATEERFDQTSESFGSTVLDALAAPPVFDETRFAAPVPDGTPAAPLTPALPPDPAVTAALAAMRIRMLAPDQLTMNNEYRRISTIPAYTPLLHTGWVQPGLAAADAPTLDLATLGILNPSGKVRVHLERFLHITLDLTYQAAAGETAAVGGGDGLNEITLAPRYRLKATRSARSGELHYFDHPAFGVLVRVRPVPAQGTNTTGRRPAA